VTRLLASLSIAVLLAACSKDSAPSADTGRANGQTDKSPTEAVSGPAVAEDGTALGQLIAAEHINLNTIVNKSAAEVDAVLGAPTQTGSDRTSCVRFEPERVFFACEQEIRTYAAPPFASVRVEFEDGRASQIALSGLPGQGEFSHAAALALAGVRMPSEPRHDNPALGMGGSAQDVVDRWEWGNSSARLLVGDQQFRVRLTVVNGDWQRAKLELINNTPLTPEQRELIKPVRGAEPAQTPSP
jgi:hypothetical protein